MGCVCCHTSAKEAGGFHAPENSFIGGYPFVLAQGRCKTSSVGSAQWRTICRCSVFGLLAAFCCLWGRSSPGVGMHKASQGEPRHEGFQLSVHLAKAVGCSWDSAGLPDFVQSLALESVEACGTCVICLEQFGRASKLSCGHLYHAACIKEWCRYGDMQCPLCRTRHGAIVSEPLESGGFRIRL